MMGVKFEKLVNNKWVGVSKLGMAGYGMVWLFIIYFRPMCALFEHLKFHMGGRAGPCKPNFAHHQRLIKITFSTYISLKVFLHLFAPFFLLFCSRAG